MGSLINIVSQKQDDEIKKIVKDILDKANLEEITMKTVCRQVYSKYPDFDLSHKKEFIKTTVKSVSLIFSVGFLTDRFLFFFFENTKKI